MKNKTKKITRSHKKLDPDVKAVFDMYRALRDCSSPVVMEYNLAYIADRFGYGIYPLVKRKKV